MRGVRGLTLYITAATAGLMGCATQPLSLLQKDQPPIQSQSKMNRAEKLPDADTLVASSKNPAALVNIQSRLEDNHLHPVILSGLGSGLLVPKAEAPQAIQLAKVILTQPPHATTELLRVARVEPQFSGQVTVVREH